MHRLHSAATLRQRSPSAVEQQPLAQNREAVVTSVPLRQASSRVAQAFFSSQGERFACIDGHQTKYQVMASPLGVTCQLSLRRRGSAAGSSRCQGTQDAVTTEGLQTKPVERSGGAGSTAKQPSRPGRPSWLASCTLRKREAHARLS